MNRCRPGEIAVWQAILTKDAFGAEAMGIALAQTQTHTGELIRCQRQTGQTGDRDLCRDGKVSASRS